MTSFDQRLAEQINRLFDNYDDGTAGQGWEELRKKFPAKKTRRPIFFWLSAAAILAGLAGAWFIFEPVNTVNHSLIVKKVPARHKEQRTAALKQATGQQSKLSAAIITAAAPRSAPVYSKTGQHARPTGDQRSSTADRNSSLQAKTVQPVMTDTARQVSPPMPGILSAAVKTDDLLTPRHDPFPPAARLAAGLDRAAVSETKTERQRHRALLEISAGSQYSYAGGATGQFNINAGMASVLPVSARLSFSAGLGIVQNDLSFRDGIPRNTSGKLYDAVQGSYSNLPMGTGTGASAGLSFSTLENMNASLTGLELPLRLLYSFPRSKRPAFISAGISSYTYISERYTSEYRVTPLFSASYLQSTNVEVISRHFQTFDLAGMLNLSAGAGYPIGKQRILFIAPFLNYPLQGLGYQKIRYGSGGINLKMNFSGTEK